MIKKTVIINVNKLSNDLLNPTNAAHIEEYQLANYMVNQGWKCVLADWHDINLDTMECQVAYDFNRGSLLNNIAVNDDFKLIVARSLGSVEAQYFNLIRYFSMLENQFNGSTINNPSSMTYGMNKLYLKNLSELGYPVIESIFFDPGISYEKILESLPWSAENTIIKPTSGELGNSVVKFSEIDDSFFRYKETKIQGWIAQRFIPGIYDGEISLIYVDNEFCYAIKKTPSGGDFRTNERYRPSYELINPDKELINIGEKLLNDWPHPVYIARIDIILDKKNIYILEVETVNPGYLYGDNAHNTEQIISLKKIEDLATRLVSKGI